MDDDTGAEWTALGAALRELDGEKFEEAKRALRELVDAQRIIARYDWQLPFRGRPRKRYLA
jgi:hypothetical protein